MAAREKLPWYPMYAQDYNNDMAVLLMSSAERGMYHMLLNAQWMEDGLPDDLRALQVLAKEPDEAAFKDAWERSLETLFPVGAGGLRRNPRLEAIAREQGQRRKRRSKIATDAARVRWDGAAEQRRDAELAAADSAVQEWLANATPQRRKAMRARAKKRVATELGTSKSEVGKVTRANLERAMLAQILRELEEIA